MQWKSHSAETIEARVRSAYKCSTVQMIISAKEQLTVLHEEYSIRLRVLDELIIEKKRALNGIVGDK